MYHDRTTASTLESRSSRGGFGWASAFRRFGVALLAAGLPALLVGCDGSTARYTNGSTAKYTIGMSQSNLTEPWREQMVKDIEKAARAHPDIEVIVENAGGDSRKQKAQVRQFINQQFDLIIISPHEAVPLTKPVGDSIDAGRCRMFNPVSRLVTSSR